jgi:hypothetical protein
MKTLRRMLNISKLNDDKLHNLHSSPNIRTTKLWMKQARHADRMAEPRNVYKIFTGQAEGKRPLATSRRRWGNNIKTDITERGLDVVACFDLAVDKGRWRAPVNMVTNLTSQAYY